LWHFQKRNSFVGVFKSILNSFAGSTDYRRKPNMKITKGANGLYITWPTTVIPASFYTRIKAEVAVSRDYLGKDTPDAIDPHAAMSMRHILIKDKIIRGYGRMNARIRKITSEYSKKSIIELSRTYDFPPLNLLRGILLQRKFNKSDVYAVFAGREEPDQLLSGRDLTQYNLACAADAECHFSQSAITARGAENERRVVAFFANLTKIKTQEELVAEQIVTHGRAVNTPDVLFASPVFVNNTRVYWMDFKDYTGTTTRFIFNSNCEQAARYVKEWGAGILCYSGGVVDDVNIPSVMVLDGRELGIEFAK
jgi:hypothetical protein